MSVINSDISNFYDSLFAIFDWTTQFEGACLPTVAAGESAKHLGPWESLGPLANPIFWQDLLVLICVGAVAWLVYASWTRPNWRRTISHIFSTHRSRWAFGILVIYGVIGILDSFVWRDFPPSAAPSAPVSEQAESQPKQHSQVAKTRSLLDRLDRLTFNLTGSNEDTYSGPLAHQAFSKITKQRPDGTRYRMYPPVEHKYKHILGTDELGKDVFYQSLKGIRTAWIVGGITTVIAIPFALFFGLAAGYFGKWIDDIITYMYSTLASIPWILLVIAFVVSFGNGLLQICIVLGITSWVGLCRLVRGEVLKVREMDYIQAAKAIGANPFYIQLKHILPNVMHLVIISAVLLFSRLVLAEAVLSYLGVGVGAQTPSWGAMINQGRFELSREPIIWWNLTAAFVMMFGLVFSANVFGDALRDALDPRLGKEN
jgi:peptide/nickel transport system permease protein